MRTLLDDLRFTLRQLRRAPGFVLTAVLTLTLAIAANVVVYGIADGLIWHRLAVPEPGQLVEVQNPGFLGISFSYPNYRDLRERTQGTFSSLTLARLTRFSLDIGGAAQPVWGYMAGGNYFSTLGVQAQLGRVLTPGDDVVENGSAVMVLSDRCWRVRFGADPGIVGKVVPVGKIPFTVIGVAPRGFNGTEQFFAPEAWMPYHDGPEIDGGGGFEFRGSTNAEVYGRLRPGVSRDEADADLRRVSAQMAHEFPEDQGTAWHTAPVGLLGDSLGKPVRSFIWGVAALAGLVLLAACANLGVLFSSRTADRARELGIRLAIGSTRQRILRQLGIEALVIALAGGVIASGMAALLLHALSLWQPPSSAPLRLQVDADWKVYAVSAGVALLTGLLFGALPARQVWRTDPNRSMRSAGSTAGTEHSWLRSGLLLVQVALCCLLVTASLVAVRGLQRTFAMPLGFAPQGVTLAIVDTKLAGYTYAEQRGIQERLLAAVKAIPGVSAAAYGNDQPLSLNMNQDDVYAPGTPVFDHAHIRATVSVFRVGPGYFATAGIPVTEGREFTVHDDGKAPQRAVINETLARRLFGTTDAVGKRFPMAADSEFEVVGVVRDGKYQTLSEEPTPALFRSILQAPDSTEVLLARSDRSPAEMTIAMRKAVASVDSSIPVFSCTSWPDALGIVTLPARAATMALGVMGALAAMLAVTGVFGVASYTVARRMREFGIRVALGSRWSGVLLAALGRTAVLMAGGSAVGLLLGVLSSKLLAGVVYHASASDPVVLCGVVLAMVGLGVVASLVPARRAMRAEPAALLREG